MDAAGWAVKPLRLSPTSLRRWRECPHAYWHAYIRKSPKETAFNRPVERGGAIHHLLRASFDHLLAAGEFPDDLPARAVEHLPRLRYPDAEAWRADVRWIADHAGRYLSTLSPRLARAHHVALEWARTYEHPAFPSFLLTARADRVVRIAAGRYRIIEYKSGKPDVYDLVQIAALHLCFARALHAADHQITVSVVFLRTNEEREWTFGPGIAEYRERITEIAHAIRTALADESRFAPTPGPYCRTCPYLHRCPAAPPEYT